LLLKNIFQVIILFLLSGFHSKLLLKHAFDYIYTTPP